MKDVGFSLRKAYFNKLNGAVTLNANNVPTYDNVPDNAAYPYIQISNISVIDESTKTNFNNNCVVTIQIFTGTDGTNYTKSDADNISNQVMLLLLNRSSLPDASADFKVITNSLESTNYIESQYDGFYEVRKVIRIRNIVEQL
jgi:phage terminase large subunit GpA-like protein